jgi:hypothetical protein
MLENDCPRMVRMNQSRIASVKLSARRRGTVSSDRPARVLGADF